MEDIRKVGKYFIVAGNYSARMVDASKGERMEAMFENDRDATLHEDIVDRNFLYYKAGKNAVGQLLPFNVANVRLHAPVNKQGNTKMIKPYYLHEGLPIPLRFQTPMMFTPFELDYPRYGNDDVPAKKSYKQFSLSFRDESEGNEIGLFRKFLNEIDEAVVNILYTKHSEWFGTRGRKAVARNVVEHQYGYMIKSGVHEKKTTQYPDRIQVKCNVRSGLLQTAFFDDERNKILNEEQIRMAQGEAIAVLEYASIWVVQGFHPRVEGRQVQLFSNEDSQQNFGIVESVDSDGGH